MTGYWVLILDSAPSILDAGYWVLILDSAPSFLMPSYWALIFDFVPSFKMPGHWGLILDSAPSILNAGILGFDFRLLSRNSPPFKNALKLVDSVISKPIYNSKTLELRIYYLK